MIEVYFYTGKNYEENIFSYSAESVPAYVIGQPVFLSIDCNPIHPKPWHPKPMEKRKFLIEDIHYSVREIWSSQGSPQHSQLIEIFIQKTS